MGSDGCLEVDGSLRLRGSHGSMVRDEWIMRWFEGDGTKVMKELR